MKARRITVSSNGISGSFFWQLAVTAFLAILLIAGFVYFMAIALGNVGYGPYASHRAYPATAANHPEPTFPTFQPANNLQGHWLDLRSTQHHEVHDRKDRGGASKAQKAAEELAPEASGKEEQQKSHWYEPNCNGPRDSSASDDCAAWAAVSEYSFANWIAKHGLVIQSIGIVASLFGAGFTMFGIIVASRAAELASQANLITLHMQGGFLVPTLKIDETGRCLVIGAKNIGSSRASTITIGHAPLEIGENPPALARAVVQRIVEEGDEVIVAYGIALARRIFVALEMKDAVGAVRNVNAIFVRDGSKYECEKEFEHEPDTLLSSLWLKLKQLVSRPFVWIRRAAPSRLATVKAPSSVAAGRIRGESDRISRQMGKTTRRNKPRA